MMEIIGKFKSEFQTILVTTDKLFLSKWLKRIKRLNSQVWDYMFPKLLETFYLLLWICLLQYRNTLMVPTAITLMVSEEPLIFVKFLERFQVSSSQIQSIFFHFGNLMVLIMFSWVLSWVSEGFLSKVCSHNFHKIHRITPKPEFLF